MWLALRLVACRSRHVVTHTDARDAPARTFSFLESRAIRKSNRRLSALSGVGIVLVVLGHAEYAGQAPLHSQPFYAEFRRFVAWINSYHMPLFFVLSGYLLMAATLRRGECRAPAYDKFLADKARRLLGPYVLISTVAFPVKALLSQHAQHTVELSMAGYLTTLLFPWRNTIQFFWFLPTLFLIFAASPVLVGTRRSRWLDGLVVCAAMASWWLSSGQPDSPLFDFANLGGVLHTALFFVVGFALCKYGCDGALLNVPRLFLLAGPLALGVHEVWPVDWLHPSSALLALAYVVLGVGFVGALARIAEAPFAWLGDHSFEIYLFSWFGQVSVRIVFAQLLHIDARLYVVMSVAAGLGVPLLCAKLRDDLLPSRFHALLGGATTAPAPVGLQRWSDRESGLLRDDRRDRSVPAGLHGVMRRALRRRRPACDRSRL